MLKRLSLWVAVILSLWGAEFSWYSRTLSAPRVMVELSHGEGLRQVAMDLWHQGLLLEPVSFVVAGKIMGRQASIKAGSYPVPSPTTALELLNRISAPSMVQYQVTLVEGTTFAQFRKALEQNALLKHETSAWSDAKILQALQQEGGRAEGLFLPNSYFFLSGDSDLSVLERSHRALEVALARAWAQRDADLPLKTPLEALTLASIIEKETAKAAERPLIAGVFVNRLRLGMRLQTDPTVIYGLGQRFDGNLHKRDLLQDTPYNTYTRKGLPPGPIAMPSEAALQAALHPATTTALYFVARGDGGHQFSESLKEHNRAVTKYQINPH
jgi:UPF0755 protein